MTGINRNARHHLADTIAGHGSDVQAIATQQYQVISDPTHATGDPAHLWATVVLGWLGTICGINEYGIATYHSGTWTQI